MKNTYFDLVDQTFDFPQDEFTLQDNCLHFHGIDMYELIQKYGTPMKVTFLPRISQQIQNAKKWFNNAIDDFFLKLWRILFDFFVEAGSVVLFFIDSLKLIFVKPYRFDEIIKKHWKI